MTLSVHTTLRGLLDYCGEPDSLDDRVARVAAVSKRFPMFRAFLELAFKPEPFMTFKEVVEYQGFNVLDNNTQGTMNFHQVVNELRRYADGSRMRASIRHSQLLQELDCLPDGDAALLVGALGAKYNYNDRINPLVIKSAFPEWFSPKA